MNRFSMPLRVSAREIERIVDRLAVIPSEFSPVTEAQEVRVAAAQLLLRRYRDLSDYVADMSGYIADAVNRRAALVCFPAWTGLLPASLLPQFDKVLAAVRPQPGSARPETGALAGALTACSDALFDTYFLTMSTLAARHRVSVMAGTSLYYERGALCHRALLFGSDGELLGYQDKLSLTPLEQALGIEPATEIKVFETVAGPAALVIGSDANYYEIARAARSLGARMLLHPTAFTGEYTPVRQTLGLNMRAQESRLWGIQSVPVGDTGLGFAAEGHCALFGPVELSAETSGTMGRSSGRFEPDLMCVTLNHDRLTAVKNPYRQDLNMEFLERYIDRLY